MKVLIDELTPLKLHGMAQCAMQLLAQSKPPTWQTALHKLIDIEKIERGIRRIRYQTRAARFPHHKDFSSFNYLVSVVPKDTLEPVMTGVFTEQASNLILVGGTGTGKTHIAIALGMELISTHKRVRFFNAVDLINQFISEQ